MYAHSKNEAGHWHDLVDHCKNTASLARRFAAPFGGAELAETLGLVHDAGKAYCGWQRRLIDVSVNGGQIGIPHADVGAHLIKKTADIAALAVLGHHKGLTERGELDDGPGDKVRFLETIEAFLAAVPRAKDLVDGPSLVPEAWLTNWSLCDIGIRMIFSTLVDADYLDTAAHYTANRDQKIGLDLDAANMVERFEQGRELVQRNPSPMDALRDEIYKQAIVAARLRPGLFRLTAPTGSGKTLTSAGFGLHHAAHHGHRRVIMAMPFITITRQNADVLGNYLGADTVLEHHSNIDATGRGWMRLAAENWDAPFIVTTTVQLFESLFARKPYRMRKLHRIAGSVIIIDEVQALPVTMLDPILDALRILIEHFGCTVLLCTATQPTFDELPVWRRLPVTEIIEPKRVFARARSVRYRYWIDPKPTWDQVAIHAANRDPSQALLIVNTLRDAILLYQACQRSATGHIVLHLSRGMCDQHVTDTLATITKILQTGKKLLVVSTQLIEAGVDIDFPVVYRAWATGEAHIQSAGRCDREGLRGNGEVIIFDPTEGTRPRGYYITASGIAREYFGPGNKADPDNIDALSDYFRATYTTIGLANLKFPIDKNRWQDWHHIRHNRANLNFRDVAEGPHAFRMIEEDTVPVVITTYSPHNGERPDIDSMLARLGSRSHTKPDEFKSIYRQLQPYVVSIRKSTAQRRDLQEHVVAVIDDVLYKWKGPYDPITGLDIHSDHFLI